MTTLTPEDWAQVRAAYEARETPVEDICVQYDISSTTLRNRMRRWGWTRRRPPVPLEGPGAVRAMTPSFSPPPVREANGGEGSGVGGHCAIEHVALPRPTPPALADARAGDPPHRFAGGGMENIAAAQTVDPPPPEPAPGRAQARPGWEGEGAPADLGAQLQSAVARVLPAIEAIIARLAAGAGPREMEQAGRALSSLTRTLRELNALLAQHNAHAGTAHRCANCADMPEDMDAFREQLARRIRAFVASRQAEGGEAKAEET
ncbi:MAG: hypothetical protein JSR72_01020 [Proteobacteria bacterium]|nr:hypothetical protein [Pseudomonadota bacterium]